MKTNVWMLLTIVLGSCGLGENVFSRKYVLENGTGRELKSDFFYRGRYLDTGYVVGSGIVADGIADDGGRNHPLNPSAAFGGVDSIVITYDNAKRQVYYRDEGYKAIPQTNRHILNNDTYVIENDELYRYIFTEEDYENAEIID